MTTTKATFTKYPAYKNSGVEWLGEIPMGWEYIRMKRLYWDYSKKNRPDAELLSVTQNQGVVPRTWVENRMVMPSGALESFKFINKGDFAISLRSFEGGLEYCHHDGIISPAYTVLKKRRNDLIEGFYKYLFKSYSFISELQTSVVGIREGKNISYPELSYSFLPVPPKNEQTAIAHFLDDKTAKIDRAIAQKEQLIALLKERKQIIIQNAVTKGLDPNVKLKDSGVEWIGEIPEGWEVKRGSFLAQIVRGASPRPSGHPLYFNGDHTNWVTVGEITKDESLYLNSTSSYLTRHGKELSRYIEKGTFVLSNSGATLGVPKIMAISGCINDGVLAFLNLKQDLIIKHFLYYFLSAQTIRLRVELNQGATQPNLNTDLVKKMPIPLPSVNEQSGIVQHIEAQFTKIDQAISLQQTQIEKLKEYKATLIDSAVTGKIKVSF